MIFYFRYIFRRIISMMVLFLIFNLSSAASNQIPTPETWFGFRPGTDYKLITYKKLADYLFQISLLSDRVKFEEIGTTTEGLPLVLLTITSAKNHEQIGYLQQIQSCLADPRQITNRDSPFLLTVGKIIVSINCSLHSDEIGPSQMVPNLVYRLATQNNAEIQQILENVIILLVPVQNPDGLDKIIHWYEQYLGTRYEGIPLPWLYHKYTGHDINRDWFMFTQRETQIVIEEIFNKWHPHLVLDLHQMGRYSARQFIPPYIDPIDPNIHPLLLDGLAVLGDSLLSALSREGKTGVVNRALFDSWTPARGFPFYYGGLRILAETASCKIASPVNIDPKNLHIGNQYHPLKVTPNHPHPWPGGKWSLEQIVDYIESVVYHTLNLAAKNKKYWLQNFYRVCQQAVAPKDAPFAYAIPPKQHNAATLRSLLGRLNWAKIEIYQTVQSIQAGTFQADSGTYIIPMAQPRGAFVKTLFNNVNYPLMVGEPKNPLQTSYDITTHCLPLFLGVRIMELKQPLGPNLVRRIHSIHQPKGRISGGQGRYGFLIDYSSNDANKLIHRLFKQKHDFIWLGDTCTVFRKVFPQGSIFLQPTDADSITRMALDCGLDLWGMDEPILFSGYKVHPPQVGLYQSWCANIDEGWTRFVLEQFHLDYTTVHDANLKNDRLTAKFDVIIFPDMSGKKILIGNPGAHYPEQFSGGIGNRGLQNIKKFVRNGGMLVLLDSACELAGDDFNIPVVNIVKNLSLSAFYVPGTLVSVNLNSRHPVCFGLPAEIPILFYNSPVFQISEGQVIAQYSNEPVIYSGLVRGRHYLKNQIAIAEVEYGKGRIILFGCRPQFRAQTEFTFKLLFNSIYLSTADIYLHSK